MEERGITESTNRIALEPRNISKQEEKAGKTRLSSQIINKDLMLIIKGSYHKTTIITALWRGEK